MKSKDVPKAEALLGRRRKMSSIVKDYTAEETRFMMALDAYKREHGRTFLTCAEILEVVKELGYHL